MKKVLIIEDEASMRRNISILLTIEGYQVFEAPNGRIGVEAARTHLPDLILCDINMPELDGYAVLSMVRESPRLSNVPFIFLTARGSRKDVRSGMNLGADDYLPKPFTTADLLAALEARIHRVSSLAEAAQPIFDSAEPLELHGMTPSEAQVLLWMAQGKSNAEIGSIVGTTVGTVKKHAQHIFDKLGVDNRASAMLAARQMLSAPKT